MMLRSFLSRFGRICCGTILATLATLSVVMPAAGAPLVEEAFLLGDQYQPATRAFDLATTGDYTFNLSDLQFPQPLGTATALLTRGTTSVSKLSSFGSTPVALQSGRHKVLVAATPANPTGFGAFGVSLQPAAGGSNVFDFSDQARALQPTATSLQSTLQASFVVTTAGTYRLAATDLLFPATLQRLDVLVTSAGGGIVATLSQAAPTADVTLPAGTYNLLAFAEATVASGAGAYSLAVSGSGTQPYAQVQGVGAVTAVSTVTLGAGGTHTLQVVDLSVPAPLAAVRALVSRGDVVLVRSDAAGSTEFSAAAGAATLIVVQSPGVGFDRGASDVIIASGASRVFERVAVTTPAQASGNAVLVAEPVEVPATGTYRVELTDFAFPAPVANANLYVVQGGTQLAQLAAPGAVDINATAGPLYLLLDAAPNAVTRSSLLGSRVLQTPANTTIVDSTLALGILLQSRTIEIATSGSYDLTVADLNFPAALADLALAVTRGGERVAAIYGSGSVRFNATAGRYSLNLLARPTDARGFGAYALRLDATPPPPVVTFTADPTRVRQGATTQLSWSATGATGCVASDGWSGSRPTSGTFTTAALEAGTRFTITCTGFGGSTAASVNVEVRPSDTSGGGGAAGPGLLALFATLLALARRRTGSA
jgi:hypothetical protein